VHRVAASCIRFMEFSLGMATLNRTPSRPERPKNICLLGRDLIRSGAHIAKGSIRPEVCCGGDESLVILHACQKSSIRRPAGRSWQVLGA